MNWRQNGILKEMFGIEGFHLKPISEPDSPIGRPRRVRLAYVLPAWICPIEPVKSFDRNFDVGIATPPRQLRRIDFDKTAVSANPGRPMSVFYNRNELFARQAVTPMSLVCDLSGPIHT